MSTIKIRKADFIKGKSLVLRNVVVADAAFILSLRTDPKKSRHLSQVSDDLGEQVAWISSYENRDTEAYFIIEDFHGVPLGTVRMYDARGESFCWGSWILLEGVVSSAAIESALMVYAYALESLGFRCAHFQVRKDNERVWKFHERFGAERTAENEVEYEYNLSNMAIEVSVNRYRRYLPYGVHVEEFLK
ncbi:N-acetyltransferase [Malikia spinosa]|uniref:N-acetyltransferase n=1 Tax=Malikia spinosa TaxID=86180 RepID=A0A2S9KDJ4_9BURK|nr:GNAT family N-acetyltransferase [Malikia spinosa]PRD68508.1 N-acetyltransferase [Malikia spinosa]